MLFTSLEYIVFLPVVVCLYWILPQKARLAVLLLASYFFYMSWMPAFILLIIGMTVFNYVWGAILHKSTDKRKSIFAIGIAANLLCLCFFKYTNLLFDSLNSVYKLSMNTNPGFHAEIILPLAISFFTFEFIHYLFDIYRGGKPVKSFILFSLFAAFFPTQIAGPIKRYQDFEKQMQNKKMFSIDYFEEGVPLIILGFAKKVLLANNLAIFVDMGYKMPMEFTSFELWLFAYAFAFQIYFDFSAYTDIARGSAMLLGYRIPINFNIPYIANSAADFWHRWHISLSTWLRDYLFIPLGGSKNGRWNTNRNLLITMALGGLWHGASWSFVVWGIYHGIALIVHREFKRFRENVPWLCNAVDSPLGYITSVILTFNIVTVGWVFFRVQDISQAFRIVERMISLRSITSMSDWNALLILRPDLPVVVFTILIMLVILLLSNWVLGFIQDKGLHKAVPRPLLGVYCGLLILIMVTFLPDGTEPFIYFQF